MENEIQMLQFQQAFQAYQQYKIQNVVPPKVELKLNFLAKCITNQKITQFQSTQYPQQLQQLKQIDLYGKIMLFISITDCMTISEQMSTQQIKAYLKKSKTLSFWQICYVRCDTKNLTIIRKKKQVFPLKQLHFSQQIKNKSGKYAFRLFIKDTKYSLGFSTQQKCKYFNQQLNNFKQGKVSKIKRLNRSPDIQRFQSLDKFDSLNVQEIITTQIENQQRKQVQQVQIIKQQQIKVCQQDDINEIQNDQQYKIIQNLQNGRLLQHYEVSQKLKISLIMKNSDYLNILYMYSNIKQWNPQVISSSIVSRLDQNVYIIYQKFKSYGFSYRQRDFLFMRSAYKKKNTYYLIDRSVQHKDYPQYSSIVRAKIIKRVTALIPHPQNSNLMLLICQAEINYGGYNREQDNKLMGLSSLKNLEYFNSYCIQKSFVTFNKNFQNLFNFQKKYNKNQRLQFDTGSLPKRLSLLVPQQPIKLIQPVKKLDNQQKMLWSIQQLLNQMPKYQQDPISDKYIDLVINLNKHYTLPLKHYHDQKLRLQFTRKKQIVEPNHFIFQNGSWILHDDGHFIFQNQKILDVQRGIIKYIIKKIGINIMTGRSIMNMSLPVQLFQNKSLLQRYANSLGYAPIYLTQAGKIQDTIQQMKLVMTFVMSMNTLQLNCLKPFNPILGQTFQCFLGNIPLSYQQVSHHPPITSFYMKSPDFQFYGSQYSFAELGLNSGIAGNTGILHVVLPVTNSHFQFLVPPCQMMGIVYGQRKFKGINRLYILCRQKQFFGQVSFGKDKKQIYPSKIKMGLANISGGIFKVTSQFIKKYTEVPNKHKFEGLTKKDVIQKYSNIQGAWNGEVIFDNKILKTLCQPIPYKLQYDRYPLPSNSNYREDVLYLRQNNLAMSQNAKQKLQLLQRNDRKLRDNARRHL